MIEYSFASIEEGRKVLEMEDDFIKRLRKNDFLIRKTESKECLIKRIIKQVLFWTKDEIDRMIYIMDNINSSLESKGFRYFFNIWLIKTTGEEEGGQVFYTRGNAIIIAQNRLTLDDDVLFSAISHELFHVFSRIYKNLRQDIYGTFNYKYDNRIIIAPEIESRMITNPDGVEIEYFCQVNDIRIVPVVLLDKLNNDNMFDSLKMVILVLDKNKYYISKDTKEIDSLYRNTIGNDIYNTHHPDEIAADYFSLIVSENKVSCEKSKQIVTDIKSILFCCDCNM